jgi:hypothetical protein
MRLLVLKKHSNACSMPYKLSEIPTNAVSLIRGVLCRVSNGSDIQTMRRWMA